jgi:hypothetical protein
MPRVHVPLLTAPMTYCVCVALLDANSALNDTV